MLLLTFITRYSCSWKSFASIPIPQKLPDGYLNFVPTIFQLDWNLAKEDEVSLEFIRPLLSCTIRAQSHDALSCWDTSSIFWFKYCVLEFWYTLQKSYLLNHCWINNYYRRVFCNFRMTEIIIDISLMLIDYIYLTRLPTHIFCW